VSSESSSGHERRGRDVALVFSMQGVGMTLAPIMVLVFLSLCEPGMYGRCDATGVLLCAAACCCVLLC
jgi:hypothetical protein